MDGLLLVACRTLDAYTVDGAGDRGRSPTDRRSFGPGARTETHANRPKRCRPCGMARWGGCWVREEPSFPAAALPLPRVRGGRRRGKKAREDSREARGQRHEAGGGVGP